MGETKKNRNTGKNLRRTGSEIVEDRVVLLTPSVLTEIRQWVSLKDSKITPVEGFSSEELTVNVYSFRNGEGLHRQFLRFRGR